MHFSLFPLHFSHFYQTLQRKGESSMEKSTANKSFDATVSQQPISMLIQPSPPYISLPKKTPNTDVSRISSSYVRPAHETAPVEDSEISIFDAHKYFNESHDPPKVSSRVSPVNMINVRPIPDQYYCDVSGAPRFSSASSADGYNRNYRARSFHATPTASSEASWNSQSGLLSNPPGAIKVSIRNPASVTDQKKRSAGSAAKWFFGRKCPCSCKKSVQVEEQLSEPKTPGRLKHNISETDGSSDHKKQIPKSSSEEIPRVEISRRISADSPFPTNLGQRILASGRPFSDGAGFMFPILNQSSTTINAVVLNSLPSATNTCLEDPPRDSLEVFRPRDESGARKSIPRQSFTLPASPRSRMTVTDDEVASDASSDLFEIESFSTQTTSNYPMCNRRDSLDEASSLAARRLAAGSTGGLYYRRSLDEPMTECAYEPSEASIDWSVTTAEASVTNYSVTPSQSDDMTMMRHESHKKSSGGSGGKRRGNGLLSCRCEKAVNVGSRPVKWVAKGVRERVGPATPASTTLRHVNSGAPNVDKPAPPARLSLPFAA